MSLQDGAAHLGGVGGAGDDVRAEGVDDRLAEGLLLVADLYHIDGEIQAVVGAGHGQGRAPLAGAGLGGQAFQPLLLGVVHLGGGGIQLMGAGGVVALEFVVDFRRGV